MENKINAETWLFLNGKLISHEKKVTNTGEWKKEDNITETLMKNLGIGFIHPLYIETNELQEKEYEYIKIIKFLNKFVEYYTENNNLNKEDVKLDFINYGKTELVYVLTEKSGKRITLLIKQPAVKFGLVKEELENLKELKKIDDKVVSPIDYYTFGDQELYVTPYINQARCVASQDCWGIYIPEPYYRFEPFTKEQSHIVNSCMIAKLLNYYDFDKNEGISKCKLGGGDFMLPKGWENETPTIENTLDNLYFIAAREKIKCTFEEYISIIIKEFSKVTINELEKDLTINIRGRVPMTKEDIKRGIKLGLELIKNRTKIYPISNKLILKYTDEKE